ncbi:MAG TPA: CHASE domain-containing protein [Acidimicrobiia bacterium]|nr:CHASE domain-containing protein [Acidimicrobiia bacterium]
MSADREQPGALSLQADHPSRAQIRRLAAAAGLIGVLLTMVVAWWVWDRAEEGAAADLASRGEEVAESVQGALDDVVDRLSALGSFYQASNLVTRDEFRQFISNFDHLPGMDGIGFMRIVAADDLAAHESTMRETIPDYQVFEFDEEGNRVPVTGRSSYVPLEWFEPDDAFGSPHGFDSTSEPTRRSALQRARIDKEAAVTEFLRLVSESEEDGFLIYWPVIEPESGDVFGFTVAPMDLNELMVANISQGMAEDLDWTIEVITAGRRPQAVVSDSWTTVMDVGSNWWALTVTRRDTGGPSPGQGGLISTVVVGLVTSALLSTGVYLYRRKAETQQELDQLRQLTRAKDQFLASVSHELRTPLTGVLGFAELLRDPDGELSDAERKSMIASVAEEATDLSAIIDDLLVAARSELDLLAITSVPVSLHAQVAQVLESMGGDAASRFEVLRDHDRRFTAVGDPGRVRQIIRNLTSNAIRYGGERRRIRFGGDDEVVFLEVLDDGPGIDSKDWERIFEPYYRVHDRATLPAAIGIGLSVARHLARLMRGDLTFGRVDGWSVFRLELPALVAESEHGLEPVAVAADR